MSDIAVVHGVGQIHHLSGPFVLGGPDGDLEYRAHLQFFPTLLENIDHRAIERAAHALVANFSPTRRLPLGWQCIRLRTFGLR